MRFITLPLLLIGSLASVSCDRALRSQQPPEKWTTGFWYWHGSSPGPWQHVQPLEVLFFQAGTIDGPADTPLSVRSNHGDTWSVWAELPDELPPAREYWLVLRFDRQSVPGMAAAPMVARRVSQLHALAQKRHWNLTGVQLDIDSPTQRLPEYATFIGEVRKGLPPGVGISITALLDWFRDGTAIAEVVKQVDEFVPQFYDLQLGTFNGGAIGAKFDAAHWGPVFNRCGKRFRIGISSFGRAAPAQPLVGSTSAARERNIEHKVDRKADNRITIGQLPSSQTERGFR
jgi:hypothetical protein